MSESPKACHTTDDELQFLRGLGRWTEVGHIRRDCLVGYLKGMEARSDWGDVNQVAVREAVLSELGVTALPA